MPAQHLEEPGLERDLALKPQFEAPTYKAAGKLAGLAALITGGDSGIGRAVAVLYAREGADVAIVHLPEEQPDADEVRTHVEGAGRRFLSIAGDVKDAAFCAAAVERTVREFGRLDVLVNNAAHQKDKPSLDEIDDAEWDKTFRTNIHAYFYFARRRSSTRAGGVIINHRLGDGLMGSKQLLDYSATKGAIPRLHEGAGAELVDRKIRVNCVAPGPVWTPLNPRAARRRRWERFGQQTPMQARGPARGDGALRSCSWPRNADSSYMTGEVVALMGGETTAG
jgi:NAD(P)-dependent dehydrogenase (short-subunit alcohol dehydrogenase family)